MKTQFSKCRRTRHLEPESGIALITVLFLLIIMSILGIAMVATVNSDMLINGYYGNSRAAYYAADSGLNIARQYLTDQLKNQVNVNPCLGWGASAASGCTSAPLPSNAATVALANLSSAFGTSSGTTFPSGQLNVANAAVTNGLNASTSWPSSFIIQNSSSCTNSFSTPTTTTTASPINSNLIATYTYNFPYVICATGIASSASMQHATVMERGTLTLVIQAQDTPPPTFAGYGQFVQNQNPCPGSFLTPGIYTGPTATNGAWTLGSTGVPYTFTSKLSSSASQIYYYGTGGCPNGSTTVPLTGISATFQGGIALGAATITPPSNTYSQQWAVLDQKGYGESGNPANADLSASLLSVSATAYPSTGASTGVFLPYSHNKTTNVNTFTGGGIYVQGNASVVLAATTDTSGNPTQTYTITQGSGSNAVVTTIVTDLATNTTTFSAGTTTQSIIGIPENLATTPGQPTPSTLLYVNGNITGLTGPQNPSNSANCASSGSCTDTATPGLLTNPYPAIQNNSAVTVVGNGNIDITGNLLYANEPVTRNTSDSLSLSQGTSSSNQVLGVYTANGAIVLSTPYSDNNLETDGSLAAIGSSSVCGTSTCGFQTASGSAGVINTWTNVGGQIQSNQFVSTITAANTYYDQRFSAWSNFFPPWFPSTSTSGTNYVAQAPSRTLTQQRTSWVWIPVQ
jgi:Tfp pilus assembly protein PilX